MMALFKKIPPFCAAAVAALCLVQPATGWAAFTNNGNGTVTDSETGLTWDRCTLGLSGATCATGGAATYTWAQALAEVTARNASNHLGFNDWRLPNVKELESIVDLAVYTPAIDVIAFPNTPSDFFWSSTTYTPGPAYAWVVNFDDGDTNDDGKTVNGHVRLVRSGQSFSSFDLLASPTLVAQTLTFGVAPAGVVLGATPTVTATSGIPNSGNAIVYGSTTLTICTVNSSTGLVTTLAAGTCTITADQAGDASYTAAPQITQSFSVGQATQTISFPAQTPATQTFVAAGTFAINPVATGGASGNPVTYSSLTMSVCTVSGTTVTIVAVGTCTVAADQAGNANYSAAAQVTQNVAIGQAAQTVTFGASPIGVVVGGSVTVAATSASPNSNNPIVYSSTTPTICSVNSSTGVVTALAAGICTISAFQAGDASFAAGQVAISFAVSPAPSAAAAHPVPSLGALALLALGFLVAVLGARRRAR